MVGPQSAIGGVPRSREDAGLRKPSRVDVLQRLQLQRCVLPRPVPIRLIIPYGDHLSDRAAPLKFYALPDMAPRLRPSTSHAPSGMRVTEGRTTRRDRTRRLPPRRRRTRQRDDDDARRMKPREEEDARDRFRLA
ncbi:hypothetical protein HPB48_002724 [Haemaphysalis longicornis]|uniref:Uncharacterized protein n=1 Tax=Haemaphysalis longicornis TaxID=44386 RepID=A0A9J6GQK9_HAELO|nr:hypothetical protein HPB48_002724 [Haemaphysalis longicornis]